MASKITRSEFESEVFELTSQDERRFFVHGSILSSHSEPFRAVVTGDWNESTQKKIDLSEWDGDTIARFVNFLYSSNYRYPEPTPISPDTLDEQQEQYDELGSGIERSLTPLSQCLQDDDGEDEDLYATGLESFDPNRYSFKEVLLTHAKIYTLAQYKDVVSLRKLALKRILQIFLLIDRIQPNSQLIVDIIHLIEYVYSHTGALQSSEEPLRKIVSQFVALNLPAFQTREEMADLVGQGGDFAKDLVAKVSRRLSGRVPIRFGAAKFISNIRVKYGTSSDKPPDYIHEVDGEVGDINNSLGGTCYIWLFPEYTFDPRDACTSFQLAQNCAVISPPRGEVIEGAFCCLTPIKDPKVRRKVTTVFLLREEDIVKRSEEYDGMTGNINENRGSNAVDFHLAWRSIEP